MEHEVLIGFGSSATLAVIITSIIQSLKSYYPKIVQGGTAFFLSMALGPAISVMVWLLHATVPNMRWSDAVIVGIEASFISNGYYSLWKVFQRGFSGPPDGTPPSSEAAGNPPAVGGVV